MSTLSKRATPLQLKMLKIIEGAVVNAHHAHPTGEINDLTLRRFARSVAKRAVGTLSAQLADRLAEGEVTYPSFIEAG